MLGNEPFVLEALTLMCQRPMQSVRVMRSVLMREEGSPHWHLLSKGAEEVIKVSCSKRRDQWTTDCSHLASPSHRNFQKTQFDDGLDLHLPVIFSVICQHRLELLCVGEMGVRVNVEVVGVRGVVWRGREDESWCPSWSCVSGQTHSSTWRRGASDGMRSILTAEFLRGLLRCLFISHLLGVGGGL